MRVTQQQIDHLLKHGYVLVRGFLTHNELAAAQEGFARYFPSFDELSEMPERYPHIVEDPEHLQIEFPFSDDALNHLATHPQVIELVESLLGTNEVLLSQAAIWAKYAGFGDLEQRIHLDYEGNTLVVPRDDGAFRQVNLILYYTNVTEDLGPTYVVSQEQTKGVPIWPPFPSVKKHPELKQHEQPILASAGDMLIFSMSTFHRASAILADEGARFTQHLVYRSSRYPFAGYHQWSRFGERPEITQFIENATPRQREAIGFPPPGHDYWNDATRKAVALRYPRMDMSPY